MTDESTFLAAIIASPADIALRLVYADWLEERGDARADFLRLDAELERQRGARQDVTALVQRHAQAAAKVDPGWRAFLTTLGRPFTPALERRRSFDIDPPDLPFSEPIGWRGRLVTFGGQFTSPDAWQPGLMEDIRLLAEYVRGECAYGAADIEVHPFLCETEHERLPLTGSAVLAALKARQFKSAHIPDLDATTMPFTGYHPGTDNDEIHNDFAEQHIFTHEPGGEFISPYAELKGHVAGGHLWYVLLHPTKHDGFATFVVLFAVGLSPHGGRLLGVVTHQMCHNLCD